MFRLERAPAPLWQRALVPVLAVLVTFILVSLVILGTGVDPLAVFREVLFEPLTSRSDRLEVLVQATPLLLTGVAVAVAFRGGYYNIGAEGQLYTGALAAALVGPRLGGVPAALSVAVMLAAGFFGGALWALTPALLKIRLKVDEVVTTLLLNSVMLFLISALLNGPWRDPVSGWPRSPAIAASAQFPGIIPRSRVHLGLLVALLAVALLGWVLRRTRFGLELRAVGLGADAARFMGVRVRRVVLISALVSGGVAGLAGVGEVAGVHTYLIGELSPGYGYTGIIVATFGGLSAPGILISGLFLALIDTGTLSASRTLGVPVYLGDVLEATLLLVTLAFLLLNRYRLRWAVKRPVG
ncbi:MAG: ABC transporter, permease protein 1 (cluster 11, riboflavin/purine nucleoside/unknown) [uncultured Truepera sp.]|uniref:Nucleoside ABC transporter, permease protein 1 n=1 Tax=uncultured Truepera sp. TaxID=543023 RepID=A0A6J4VCJ2_9DEIN|nr:MAG: ABC transporter, permease protein 1 (cluster 11, riboflavin/purine nucleoside/unknown) [uncultured Truepera sp.]